MDSPPLELRPFKRGPGGRPTKHEAERRHQSLLASAARLFLERGWEGTSIDAISRDSGVAKRFIYARYPDKAALFAGALERFLEQQLGALHAFAPLPDDVDEGLRAFGKKLFELALQPGVLDFLRLFIAEAPRFPELAKLFVARNRHRVLGGIISVLSHYAKKGMIEFGDPEFRAEQFFILVAGIPQRLALLAGRDEPAREGARLEAAIRLFLDGCRRRQGAG
jgi:AcrR family transcriptional regulator